MRVARTHTRMCKHTHTHATRAQRNMEIYSRRFCWRWSQITISPFIKFNSKLRFKARASGAHISTYKHTYTEEEIQRYREREWEWEGWRGDTRIQPHIFRRLSGSGCGTLSHKHKHLEIPRQRQNKSWVRRERRRKCKYSNNGECRLADWICKTINFIIILYQHIYLYLLKTFWERSTKLELFQKIISKFANGLDRNPIKCNSRKAITLCTFIS